MITYHVANFDCHKSSRILSQSSWDLNSIFVHRTLNSDGEKNIKLSFLNVLKIYKELGSSDRIIFHAQSSLIFLIFIYFFRFKIPTKVFYDIHDLVEVPKKFSYLKIRAILMYVFEFLVLNVFRIPSMTVSNGLSIIISKRYKIQRPAVVRNVPPIIEEIITKNNNSGRVVYFGTFDRLSNEFFQFLYVNNCKIDIYGKFNYVKEKSLLSKAIEDGYIVYKGEYNPTDMSFLKNYNYLLFFINPNTVNLRFSSPNKVFQALTYGLTIITPIGYSELFYLFGNNFPFYHTATVGNSNLLSSEYIPDDSDAGNLYSLLFSIWEESKINYLK
jgi:hypothetical protein